MSYFSLDDLCATQERLPCRVSSDAEPIAGLGFLDPATAASTASSSDPRGAPLPAGTKLELPLWMCQALTRRARLGAVLEVSLPDVYSFSKRAGQLKADPLALNLPRVGPLHFYETGRHLLRFSAAEDAREDTQVAEDEELGPVLVEMLTRRFRYILDASFNSDESEAPSMTGKLDHMERKLYEEGQKSRRQLRRWFRRQTDQIHTAEMVRRHRKRKINAV